jgi:hypothetical protein
MRISIANFTTVLRSLKIHQNDCACCYDLTAMLLGMLFLDVKCAKRRPPKEAA